MCAVQINDDGTSGQDSSAADQRRWSEMQKIRRKFFCLISRKYFLIAGNVMRPQVLGKI